VVTAGACVGAAKGAGTGWLTTGAASLGAGGAWTSAICGDGACGSDAGGETAGGVAHALSQMNIAIAAPTRAASGRRLTLPPAR
jgi:hypothetical protein